MKKNVLVFPCGSEIGLEIYKSLSLSIHYNLFGGSSVDDHGRFVYKNYIPDIPNVDDEKFIASIKSIIKKYKIDYIFPAHDSVVLKLAIEKSINNINCEVITSPVETCKIARSKLETYKVLENTISTPRVYKNESELNIDSFPIFLKPDVGQGSKGVYKATNIEQVRFYRSIDPSLLLLEYLPGREYTIDCFTDFKGKLLFCKGRERKRVLNGISVNSTIVNDEDFIDIAYKLNSKLKFNGAWFFQVKERSNGQLVLLEIAPRIAGTTGLSRGIGVNLPLLSLFNASGVELEIIENNYDLEIDRALENRYKHNINYSHIYIDLDDLIVINDRVNPMIIAFIYQSVNNNVKVHLLTRHKKDINKTLKKYRLAELFDEVILVKNEEKKSVYINKKDAIFIDDSFSEREDVINNVNIPVFDGHMIESLME